jgi:regulator of sirC expression with transglutaminase-like and TPR domain
LLRKRASALLDLFAREDADTEFLRFCLTQGEEFDLETGAFLLAKTTLAQTNVQAYSALLDHFASELRLQLRAKNSGAENLAIINDCVFDQLGFSGNEENYYDPANSYLPEVIDRRSGNPISLCSIYMFIGKRLQLPIIGIGLPGHFVCRYQSTTEEYYIDAFNRGKLLTKNDCIKFLVKTNHTLQEGYLLPMSPRRILMRMCANLHQIYTELKYPQETERFQRYLVALAK